VGNTQNGVNTKLPRRVVVKELISGRYSPGARPLSWDERREQVEIVRTTSGEQIKLFSNGGQSTPGAGWELLLTKLRPHQGEEAVGEEAIEWTLYGLKRLD